MITLIGIGLGCKFDENPEIEEIPLGLESKNSPSETIVG